MVYVNSLNVRRRAIYRESAFAQNVHHPAVGDILVAFEACLASLAS